MRAAARYGNAPAWIEPIYSQAADLLWRLELGLIAPGDVPAPWDDVVVAVKAGIEEARADNAKRKPGAVATPVATADEREAFIARVRAQQGQGGKG